MNCVRCARSLLAAIAAACTCASFAALQATDDTGATVIVNAPAKRIVSLAPHATELLFAAGGGDSVVGVIDTSDWPAAARTRPRVGDARALDLERIVALKPDLIVTWPYTAPAQVDWLRARGIAVFMTDPKTIEGIAADIERLGTLLGTRTRAEPVAAQIRNHLARLRKESAGKAPISVFYEIWPSPLFTIGGNHLITQALAVCGGTNVFASLTLPAPMVSIEAVLAAAPEAIIAAADDGLRPDWLNEWKRWDALPAVARNNLLVVDGNLLHRAGPRFVDGVDQVCAALDVARQHRESLSPEAKR
jgi:iron complex transport system substrate-binding protein